jgi:sugar lactone lactonase YvrE
MGSSPSALRRYPIAGKLTVLLQERQGSAVLTKCHAWSITTTAFIALLALSPSRAHAQTPNPNAAPNPYRLQENWAQLPGGRKFGQAIKVQVDQSDGKSMWVFERCGAKECTHSTIAPIIKLTPSGAFEKAIGADKFTVPHAFCVDRDGNVWAGDQTAKNGKGADLIKFSPDGQILMTLGKPGMPGDAPGYLSAVSAVTTAPNGDIYVVDGHGPGSNDRVVKFAKDGKLISAWGKHGKAAGEFDTPHGIALDSAGRVYVADRSNNRIQIFEPDGKFVAKWKQFGRPSDVAIDKHDMIYVADSQSTPATNPGFKQGIRVGTLKDGKVTAFIPFETGAPEGVGVDDEGNVYGGQVAETNVLRFVKK